MPNSYVVRIETDKRGRATGVAYFDREAPRAFPEGARRHRVRATAPKRRACCSCRPTQSFPQGLANSSGLVGKYLMFNYTSRASGVFEHELNEYKSVQVTRILHDFYDSDPKRGFYGGGGLDARIGPQPIVWALRAALGGPVVGQCVQGSGSRSFRVP